MRTFCCLAASLFLLVVSFPAAMTRAAVYRCVLDGGHISYQQFACHDEGGPMVLEERTSGWTSLRPGEQALLEGYKKNDPARHHRPRAPQKNQVRDPESCWTKRKQLEAVRSKLRRGYRVEEGDALRRKQDNYESYLRQFCS